MIELNILDLFKYNVFYVIIASNFARSLHWHSVCLGTNKVCNIENLNRTYSLIRSCLPIHILKIIKPIHLFSPTPQLRSLEYVSTYVLTTTRTEKRHWNWCKLSLKWFGKHWLWCPSSICNNVSVCISIWKMRSKLESTFKSIVILSSFTHT